MECLACGDCCRRMSPVSGEDVPCPFLTTDGTICSCAAYERRPAQCANHDFPSRFCPVGVSVLGLDDATRVAQRIDEVWARRK